ncbi:hypothetical protein, partial [Raoultella planticola]
MILVEGNARHAVYSFGQTVPRWQSGAMTWQGSPDGAAAPAFSYVGFDGAAKLFAGSKIQWDAVLAADKADKPLPRG